MRDLPQGTVSFLFSDIEGSTRLLQQIGRDAYAKVLARHNSLFGEVAGPAVVSTEGDSHFCAFDRPAAAVAASVEIQRRLAEQDWGAGGPLLVRMGLHTGEGLLSGGNYVGLDVHRAARIMAAAHGGQVLVSEATQSLIGELLPAGASLRDLGEHRLKDLARPERLYQLVVDGLREDFPSPNSIESQASRLPDYLTTFVGREAELEAVGQLLDSNRMVTLTGIGGAGKTRLAVEAGRSGLGFPDGVIFVGLEDATDRISVIKEVADSMAVGEQVARSLEDTVMERLEFRKALLILDNCEQVVDSVAEFAEEILSNSDLAILVTSREPLRIRGERVFRVGSLQMPDADESGMAAALEAEAVRLFVDRAQLADYGFDEERWARECVDICKKLEGIPLAIELAAARVDVMSPGDILAHLDARFELLTARERSSVLRHETLEAAIDWSYDLLEDDAKRLFRALSVFRGGFSAGSVAAVCFGSDASELRVLEDLAKLSEKSLISRDVDSPRTRFRQLDTVREYALMRLHEAGEYEAVNERHREYFTDLARREARRLGLGEQLEALDVLEADHDNLRAVMHRALASGDVEAAADMAGWLSWFWYLHGHFSEGERWARDLLDSIPENPSRPWLRLLTGAAQYDFRTGSYERSQQRLEMTLDFARRLGVPRMEMWAHAYLATNYLYQVHLDEAAREAAKANGIADELGDMVGLAYATYLSISCELGRLDREGALDASRSADLATRLEPIGQAVLAFGERNMIGHVAQIQGTLLDAAGRRHEAAAAFDASIEALTQLKQVGCSCHVLEAIALFVAGNNEPRLAARLIGAAGRMREQIGIRVAPVEARFRDEALLEIGSALTSDQQAEEFEEGSRFGLNESAQLARQALARF